jgi:hypothetical protein
VNPYCHVTAILSRRTNVRGMAATEGHPCHRCTEALAWCVNCTWRDHAPTTDTTPDPGANA